MIYLGKAEEIKVALFEDNPSYVAWTKKYPNREILKVEPVEQLHCGHSKDPKIFIVYRESVEVGGETCC